MIEIYEEEMEKMVYTFALEIMEGGDSKMKRVGWKKARSACTGHDFFLII